MKKYFLGVVCFIYVGIIVYIKLSGNLGNFLAPQMQKYILASSLVLIILGSSLFIKAGDKFILSDIVLLLPIIMLILSSSGELSSSLANNRTNNFDFGINYNEIEQSKLLDEDKTYENVDFSDVDVEFVDASYEQLGNYFTYNNNSIKYEGKTVRIRGFALINENIPKGYFGIGKYAISCCAADATFAGVIAKSANHEIRPNAWYEIEGVFEKSTFDNIALVLKVINIKEIDKSTEEYYVYPCYAYDDGLCSELSKYEF